MSVLGSGYVGGVNPSGAATAADSHSPTSIAETAKNNASVLNHRGVYLLSPLNNKPGPINNADASTPTPDPIPTHAGDRTYSRRPGFTGAPRKKKHLLLKIVGVLVILLILLILLLPTIASLGLVRGIVVESKVNDNLNGSVSIGSYSLGWFGGISAIDVKVYDTKKTLILELKSFKTDMVPCSMPSAAGTR